MKPDELAIVGLGLIGGSLALDARASGFAGRLLGVETSGANARRALELGLVDEVLPLEEAAGRAELIVIATPVDAALKLLRPLLDMLSEGQTLTDMCSTKVALVESVAGCRNRVRFVPGHPMAGTENSGPDAAQAGLFAGKAGIICDAEDSAPDAVRRVEELFRAVGLRIVHLGAAEHDLDVAFVSHLSHVISYALALTVMDKDDNEGRIRNLASGGFGSTARLAKSSAAMWAPIFATNRENVLEMVDLYLRKLGELRGAIARSDDTELRAMIDKANNIRRML